MREFKYIYELYYMFENPPIVAIIIKYKLWQKFWLYYKIWATGELLGGDRHTDMQADTHTLILNSPIDS